MADNKPARRYTPEDKRTGLIAVLVTGSATHAAEQTGIPRTTLESWRDNSETELFAQLSREYGPLIEQVITAQTRESVVRLGQAERQLTDRLLENLDRLDPRDVPNAIKNIVAAKSQNTDKLMLLTGRATERVEHVDARDILADIQKIVTPYINTTAEEDNG
jgi:transposase-like protein